MNSLLLVAVVIVFALIFFLLRRGKAASQQAPVIKEFAPSAENDKVVIVNGWREEELHKIIDDFVELYKEDSYPAYTIQLAKTAQNIYRLSFPRDIHPMLFTFLINYLAYPFDFDLTRRSIVPGAKTTLGSGFNGIDASLFGAKAVLYLPENDQDHDVVYMQTESGINFANSFMELVWRKVKDARLSGEVKKLFEGA